MPKQDQALSEEVETTDSDSPTEETIEQTELEADAGLTDETGVNDADTAGAEEDEPQHEASVAYERFKEVNDELVAQKTENERLSREQEVQRQLFQHPEVAEVAKRVLTGGTANVEEQVTTDPGVFVPDPFPSEIMDEENEANQLLWNTIQGLKGQIHRTTQAVTPVVQELANEKLAALDTEVTGLFATLETKCGQQLDEGEREKAIRTAAFLAASERAGGNEPTTKWLIETAFGIVVRPKLQRAKQVQADKTNLTRTRSGGGDTRESTEGLTPDEIAEKNFKKFYSGVVQEE